MHALIGAAVETETYKLVLGFVLTTVLGGLLTYLFQRLSWKRQATLDLYRERYKEGTEFLERLSSLIDRRYFALQRFIWALEEAADEKRLSEREADYFQTVLEWNTSLRSIHNRIRLLIGEEQALDFLDYGDDYRPDQPLSLHYRFVLAHRAVMTARRDRAGLATALQEVDRLNWKLSSFLYDVTSLFTERAGNLTLLHMPSHPSSGEKQRQTSGPHRLPEASGSTSAPAVATPVRAGGG